MDELFETDEKKPHASKQVGHLHRKLFLLVFAVALLVQGWVAVDKALDSYAQSLADSFKVLLTVEVPVDESQLAEWGQTLNQKADITSVRLFSPEDALTVVRHKNPQLVEALLLMGKNKMPAYFEIQVAPAAVANIRPLTDNLAAEYDHLTPHYNEAHARQLFEVTLYTKLVRGVGVLVLLCFIAFMFLVEAAPYPQTGAWGGLFAGILAGILSGGLLVAVLYPTGILSESVRYFTSAERQLLIVVLCGLLGWTLSKWQKF